jgi:tetratricopeptide (TPR) repeat protein
MASSSSRSGSLTLFRLALLAGLAFLFWTAFRQRPVVLPPELEVGQTALKAGDVAKARAQFDKALQAHPDDPILYKAVVDACQANKQWGLAISYLQSELCVFKDKLPEFRADLNLTLSSVYEQTELTRPRKNTIYTAQSAYQLAPDNFMTQNAYGYTLADNDQNLDVALDLIEKSLKTVRDYPNQDVKKALLPAVEDSYGWVLYKKGRNKEAADILRQALNDYSDDTAGENLKVSYYHLGATYRHLEEFEQARQALRSALYYDSEFMDAKEEMAKLPEPPNNVSPIISPSPSSIQKK